jgi:hypothetical protein
MILRNNFGINSLRRTVTYLKLQDGNEGPDSALVSRDVGLQYFYA